MRTARFARPRYVRWQAFVPHPGHFRIAFDPDGDDDLAGPNGYDDLYTPGTQVLLDGIPAMGAQQDYEAQVTLPDVTCTTCTLQLIQVMTDKMPWGPQGGTDLYHQCADIILDPGGAGTTGAGTTGAGTTGAGTTATGGPGSSSASDATSSNPGSGTAATATSAANDTGGAGSSRDSGGCRATPRAPTGTTGGLLLALLAARRRSQRHS